MEKRIFHRFNLLLLLILTLSVYSQENNYTKNLSSIKFLEGTFTTAISFSDTDGKWQKPVESKFTFNKIMKNKYIEGGGLVTFTPSFSTNFRMTFDYDALNNVYRLVTLDDSYGFMDIYYGNWVKNELILSNEDTGTQVINDGNRVYGKIIIKPISKVKFEIIAKVSQDDKVTWQNYMKMTFTLFKNKI
jgi:hypothetical protein